MGLRCPLTRMNERPHYVMGAMSAETNSRNPAILSGGLCGIPSTGRKGAMSDLQNASVSPLVEDAELAKYEPTIGRILRSLWYELFGPTWFSPYRQVWCVATNLNAALERTDRLLASYRPVYSARRIIQSPNDGRGTRSVAIDSAYGNSGSPDMPASLWVKPND